MISLHGVSKRFGSRLAVDRLTLDVPRGGIFGLLGHNGAGKSTTIGMLLGQVAPDAGEVRLGGIDVLADRQRALARGGAIFEILLGRLPGEQVHRFHIAVPAARPDDGSAAIHLDP